MKPITVPKPIPGFQAQTLDGEIILLHPELNIIVRINQTGALIWQLCDGTRTLDEIVEILSAAYPESRTEIQVDVPDIIQTLVSRGALKTK